MLNINEKSYFSDPKIFDIISKILKKVGINESINNAADKIAGGERSYISIVLKLIKDLADKKISEKDFCSFLETELKISEKAIESVLKDIKEEILTLAERVIVEKQEQKQREGGEEKSTNIRPVRLIIENKIISEGPIKKSSTTEIKTINGSLNEKENEEIKKYPKEPDKYRESIE